MNSTTTLDPYAVTQACSQRPKPPGCGELVRRYREIVNSGRSSWTEHHQFQKLLGAGGQGEVFLAERKGVDGFTLPIAVKLFSPEHFGDHHEYDDAMGRIAQVAARVAQIQQDNLLDVHNFIDRNRIRLMEMEWVDGYDLSKLLTNDTYRQTREKVSEKRWMYITDVIVTEGPIQPRLKAGIAVAVVRDCLAGLAALHRENIVHGDIKPSNIMIKRTGNAKIVDIGSAVDLDNLPPHRICTPAYAAPEVLEGGPQTPRADLASLGYVLVEMLSGQPPFAGMKTRTQLLEAKRSLLHRLPQIMPDEVAINPLLMNLCRNLMAPDPARRFPSAEAADMLHDGASAFHRQLIKGNLAAEYENELRLWLEELD
jgi:serine/threonine-protein kinase